MTDIVLVTAHRRAEMLALCLENIRDAARGGFEPDGRVLRVLLDRGYDPEVEQVALSHAGENGVVRRQHRYAGNSYNVLEGYREALAEADRLNARLVYLIEEDVMVARDFFQFHRLAHETFKPFCVTACESLWLQNKGVRMPPEPDRVLLTPRYQSLGVSFRTESLGEIVRHAVPEYFSDPRGYVERTFPQSRIGHSLGEQDALIDNVMHERGHSAVVPWAPRAFHAGWYGMNRANWRPEGGLESRVQQVRAVLSDPARLAALAGKHAHDCRPVPLDGHFAGSLRLK